MTKDTKKTKISIQPLGDRILLKEKTDAQEKKTASGIIIPVTVHDDKGGKVGKVIAVGSGRYEDGKLIPVSVQAGDEVLFQWGDKVKIDGEEYYIVKESELLAIIN
jgi:chaperonin GroES